MWPSQWQWAWFVVKWLIVPYQLIAAFACDQLSVHYWTSRIVILNAVLLSLREGHAVWHGWTPGVLRYANGYANIYIYGILEDILIQSDWLCMQ